MRKRKIRVMIGLLAVLALGVTAAGAPATPASAAQLSPVISGIAGGYGHGVALWSDGTVSGWGFNKYGQVGDGTAVTQQLPKKITKLPRIKQIAAGGYHSFALAEDGRIWAWGDNYTGSDYAATGQYYTRAVPHPLDGIEGAVSVHAGEYANAAVLQDGRAVAWFPVADPETYRLSIRYLNLKGLENVRSAAVSGSFVVALDREGTAWAVQLYNDYYGRFRTENELKPERLPAAGKVAAVAVSHYDAFLLQSSGKVMRYNLATKRISAVPALDGVTDIRTAGTVLTALKKDGSVWEWRYNTTPVKDPARMNGLPRVERIGGSSFGLRFAVTEEGRAYAWGSGFYDGLGTGTGLDQSPTPQPVLKPLSWEVNGEPVDFPGSSSIVNGRLHVPYNSVFQPLGISAALTGYEQGRAVWTFAYKGKTIVFKTTDPAQAYVDGVRIRDNSVNLYWRSETTQFPLAFICRTFGISLQLDQATGKVSLRNES